MMDPLKHLQMVKNAAAGSGPLGGAFQRVRDLRFTLPGFDRAVWREMCGDGWLGACVPPASGGSGLKVLGLCDVAEELGGGLSPEPLIPAAMAAQLLPAHWLPAVLSGERIVLPAWQEQANSLSLADETTLSAGRVTGRKRGVPMADGADAFLVTALGGLALVERSAPGLSLDIQPTQDGGHFGILTLDNTPGEPIEGDAVDALDAAIVATAACLLGLAERAFALTVDFMQNTEQFDRAAGTFDVGQRRLADLELQLSLTRSAVRTAAEKMDDEPQRAARQAAVSRCKLRAADAAMVVTRTCAQLHGGAAVGVAAGIGLFQQRAMVLASQYGGTVAHRARFHVSTAEPGHA